MILMWLIIVPAAGGLLAWYSDRFGRRWPRWVSLNALVLTLALVLTILPHRNAGPLQVIERGGRGQWTAELSADWIPQLGISFHLAMDGLSLILVLLTLFLGIMAVLSSWTEIRERVGFFYFNLLWVLTGIVGVFLAMDLFIFYFFWEMMLVPMYFLIALWGHENRRYAAMKFFIYTQLSGLLMLLSILGLYFIHGRSTGIYTFDYPLLLGTSMNLAVQLFLMSGFFIAFAVKLPVVPFHNWLPDAHTEAPTAGSVVLAGLLLKTGAYGLLRFMVPLFPDASFSFAPFAFGLAVVGILYGAVMAFAQTDLKRLVAYTSISHMGFVLLGVFVWNRLALQGALLQIICHGIGTGALFMLVGALQERIHTRETGRMGGLWTTAPRMGAVALFFALASLGLPGLGNFVGEFLVLLGSYRTSIPITAVAAVGIVTATVYSLWIIQRAFHGPNIHQWKIPDLSGRETAAMGVMIVSLVWIGLYPQPVFDTARPAIENLQESVQTARMNNRSDDPVIDNIANSVISKTSCLSFPQERRVGNPFENQERFRTSRNDKMTIEFGFTGNRPGNLATKKTAGSSK
jgi:NADH-quinone oxidoreductase subunit M